MAMGGCRGGRGSGIPDARAACRQLACMNPWPVAAFKSLAFHFIGRRMSCDVAALHSLHSTAQHPALPVKLVINK
jgi:hypothetical protein